MKLCLSVLVDGYFPNKVDDSLCYGVNESRVNEFALSEFAWGTTLPGGDKRSPKPGHVTPTLKFYLPPNLFRQLNRKPCNRKALHGVMGKRL